MVAVVVVVGGIMLASSASISEHVDKALSTRKALSVQLGRLRQPLVNVAIVEAERQRVEDVLAAQQAVVNASIAWNRRNYQPLVLKFKAEDGDRQVPAFPVDQQLYGRYDLTRNAAESYHVELDKLLSTLEPVVAATQKQLEEEKSLWEKKLQDEWRERAPAKTETPEAPRDAFAIDELAPVEGAARRVAPTEAQALTMAKKALLVKQAQKGMIYASKEVLDIVVPRRVLKAPPIKEIWQAQLNYWVTKDIIAAIRATNEQSARMAEARKEKPSVLNSAVKELLKIDVNEKYVAGARARGPKGGAKPKAKPKPKKKVRAGKTAGTANTLTQRASCEQYGVLHYTFRVNMPLRFLNALEKNLMSRNYHTIMGVQITQLPETPSERYYGTDPAMTVTIQGELLLLTAWERGTEHDCKISDRDLVVNGKDRWWLFAAKLSRQAGQNKPSPGKHIWSLLNTGLKQGITRKRVTSDTKQKLIREINKLLASKELYDKASWKDVKLSLWEQAMLVRLNKGMLQSADIPRLNRALLRAAFPKEIAPSPYLPALIPAELRPTKSVKLVKPINRGGR